MPWINSRQLSFFALLSPVIGLLSLTTASSGSGALPKTPNKRIVPGKSIAGLNLGATLKQAEKIWKDTGDSRLCLKLTLLLPSGKPGLYDKCHYELMPSGANFHTGSLYFYGSPGKKTVIVGVIAPNNGDRPLFDSKMNQYKTKQGIGIGSSLGALKRVFNNKLKKVSSHAGYSDYVVKGPGKSSTALSLFGTRVRSIEVRGATAP